MNKNFAVVGGDLRTVELVKMLASEGKTIYIYGLEKVEELKKDSNIIICENLYDIVKNTEIIIGPIPNIDKRIIKRVKFKNFNCRKYSP